MNNTFNFCKCCGKQLSDPVSVQLSIGPICRMKIKSIIDKSVNMFSDRAIYKYRIYKEKHVIAIIDQGTVEKSVTNDIENILCDLEKEEINLAAYNIIYRDSMGIWDGVKTKSGRFKGFYSINEKDINKACLKIQV